PGRAAAGDAGAPRDRRRADVSAGRAVPRLRHPEPDRAGGHLPLAGGAARPVHVHGRRRVPERGRGRADRPRHGLRPAADRPEGPRPAADQGPSGSRPARPGGGARDPLRGGPRPPHAARRSLRQTRERSRQLGRGTARVAGPDPRREGSRGALRPPRRLGRGRPRARRTGPAPPGADQLPRRSRGRRLAQGDRRAPPRDEGMTLDPALLARLGPLQVRARKVMEGVLTGLHASPHHGQSVEFSEHKEYAPGDEIKHIDWRAFAKLDKYYVKRFEMETNLRALLVVDASGSMNYGRGVFTKLQYAAICAGALAYLLSRQGDQVGLCIAGDGGLTPGVRDFIPPAS